MPESQFRKDHQSSAVSGPPGLRWIDTGWIDGEQHYRNDALAHNGTSYRALVAHITSAATEPGIGAGWQNVWQIIAGATPVLPKKVINRTGEKLLKGRAITAVGITAPYVEVAYATAAYELSATNTFGLLSGDLEDFAIDGAVGEVTLIGDVVGFDTDHLTAGLRTYLSADEPATGLLTSTPPSSPNYLVEMGGTLIKDVANGAVFVTVENRGNTSDVIKIFNGAILEDHNIVVASDGVNVALTLDDGADFLSLFYSAKFSKIAIPAIVNLTPGTDVAPALNYIYIPDDTKVITTSLVGFPTDKQFTPIATVICQSAPSVQTDGPYKVHAWTDHLADAIGQGHMSHINAWIRGQHAGWLNGVAPTFTGSGTATVELSTTAGRIRQLHPHDFPAFASPAEFYAINDPISPYSKHTNIAAQVLDSTGASLANKSFALVFWGVVSQSSGDCKIICNRPRGGYAASKPALAESDLSRFTDYSIPVGYKGTGFLIHRMICSLDPGGTVLTIHPYATDDIRGQFPNTVAGGAGAVNSLPATAITVTPVGGITALDVQGALADLDLYHQQPNSYQITGVKEQAADQIVLLANDDLIIGSDHYSAYLLPATGITDIDFTDLAANRSFYKTIDITAVSLAGLTITAKAALDVKGNAFDIAAWFAANLVENDTTRVIWHQVTRSGVGQRVNLSVVPLAQ